MSTSFSITTSNKLSPTFACASSLLPFGATKYTVTLKKTSRNGWYISKIFEATEATCYLVILSQSLNKGTEWYIWWAKYMYTFFTYTKMVGSKHEQHLDRSTHQDLNILIEHPIIISGRALARISKMPVQNSNSQISNHPNLATNLFQILISTTFNILLCQKGNSIFSYALEDGL